MSDVAAIRDRLDNRLNTFRNETEFIAHAPSDLEYLLSENERLRAQVEKLEADCVAMAGAILEEQEDAMIEGAGGVIPDIRDVYDEEGYLKPRDGDRIPTRSEFAALLQAIATDAGENNGDVRQDLAERFAQFLDAIYTALDSRALSSGTPVTPEGEETLSELLRRHRNCCIAIVGAITPEARSAWSDKADAHARSIEALFASRLPSPVASVGETAGALSEEERLSVQHLRDLIKDMPTSGFKRVEMTSLDRLALEMGVAIIDRLSRSPEGQQPSTVSENER